MKNVIWSLLNTIGVTLLKLRLNRLDFCIFSNDCWGAEIYRWLKIPYNTPFVGLMLMGPCYIKFLQKPEYYIQQPLAFVESSRYIHMHTFYLERDKYPIGTLDDIEIHFLHYPSREEAAEKWMRRCERISWDNLYIKISADKDLIHYDTLQYDTLQEFDSLPYQNKISLSKFDYDSIASNVKISDYVNDGALLFRKCQPDFNFIGWINASVTKHTNVSRGIGWILKLTLSRRVR